MPLLFIASEERRQTISFTPGPSLRDILDVTDLRVRSGCRGSGVCGLCRVQIEEGGANELTKNERLMLSEGERQKGIRLACQVLPTEDIKIRIMNPAPQSTWRRLAQDETPDEASLRYSFGQTSLCDGETYGAAVDLGTTNISLSLWDLKLHQRLSGRVGLNPQLLHGSDVMTRLVSARGSRKHAAEMSRMVKDAIGEALLDICSREGYDLRRIRHITIVGNTAMLALLAEKNFDLLLHPEYWMREIDCRPDDTKNWFEASGVNTDVFVEIVQPLAGFVGSDLLAGVLSTRLTEQATGSLLIDFGTNSEIALWDGSTLWVTSAAGGPAFEGSGMSCGIPAEPGAIYKIDQKNGRSELAIHVIGGGEARGLCGSGMVDLVAYLTSTGRLNRKGKFVAELVDNGLVVMEDIPAISLNTRSIDLFQRAKAAIGAGVRVLLRSAHMRTEDLRRICICGTFGRYLNVRNAQDIGLLPMTSPQHVELCGNTALAGCELLLLSSERKDYVDALRKKSGLINLSQMSEFEDLFLENLYLQPMKAD